MATMKRGWSGMICAALLAIALSAGAAELEGADPAYYHQGELAGSLKRDAPLALYDADSQSLVNRLFAAFYIRTSDIPQNVAGRFAGSKAEKSSIFWPAGSEY
jgi:hypothetical protein